MTSSTGHDHDTTQADQAQTDRPQGPRVSGAEMRDLGRLRRSVTDRRVAGVAGGLARHFDIDPTVVRVLFVITGLFGFGLLAYGACWALVPEEGRDEAAISLDERTRSVVLIAIAALVGLAAIGAGWNDGFWPGIWPLALVALIVMVIVKNRESRQHRAAYGGTAQAVAYSPMAPGTTAPAAPSAPGGNAPGSVAPTPGYAGGGTPPPPYGPTPGYQPPPPPYRVVNPRKRGPILFGFTLALVVLALGVLGMVDVSGVAVAPSAYPALATAIIAVMLLVGAFLGRAGGLIALGLLSSLVLAGMTVGEHVETTTRSITPVTAAGVATTYSQGAGEMVLDLSDVADPEALDGRSITLESGAGHIVVIVPPDTDVTATAAVGAGELLVFGTTHDGLGAETNQTLNVPDEVATLHLDVQMGFGQIEIRAS